jgi:hypothetical protein
MFLWMVSENVSRRFHARWILHGKNPRNVLMFSGKHDPELSRIFSTETLVETSRTFV